MTVREFMKLANRETFIDIRSPVYDETGSLIRYESIKEDPVEWPNIKGIDLATLDRKIQGWSLVLRAYNVQVICFDTVKGE
jgi:hypothetical protein